MIIAHLIVIFRTLLNFSRKDINITSNPYSPLEDKFSVILFQDKGLFEIPYSYDI